MFIVLSSCLLVFSTSIVDNLCLCSSINEAQITGHAQQVCNWGPGRGGGGSLRVREGESIRGVRSPLKCPGNGWKCI